MNNSLSTTTLSHEPPSHYLVGDTVVFQYPPRENTILTIIKTKEGNVIVNNIPNVTNGTENRNKDA